MNATVHIILILGNVIISVFASIMAAVVFPELGPISSKIVGGGVFLLGVQIHVIYVMRSNKEDATQRLMALHQDYQVYQDHLEQTKEETTKLREQVKVSAKSQNNEIVNEMRLLQTLLSQVVDKSGRSISGSIDVDGKPLSLELSHGQDREADEILNVMHYALEDNRIDLYLQPIVSLPSRKVMHYEAYSRVRDDKGEVIFPSQYIKLAEDSGLVSTLDNLLLFRCIQVIRRLGTRKPNMRFFCNISSVSLNDKDFFPQFVDFMLDNHELANRLVFEFTQQDVQRQPNRIWESLASLGKRGFRFSMDNVQTLNHDLADLAARYFRYVKLNPDLLLDDNIDIERGDIKEAYKRYDIEVIIEKIEGDDKLVEILDCGIDRGQGYLFGEPVLSSDITSKL
ncbi:MAG: EAL domain-containing protein [Kordiimonadaceae bacterium]|jgi:cyclic-di-GMP phosphodiesterase, flagellum assembly factor TipF|nr:EAL domain-containing protein [Kordiimonadaceae bacterium]MBT6037218.1 EAL domain-containing protein [Kordiimonadaceae bacterium]MBT6328667.1 EAL domain-containing protein [Kordiimonadaceae bacterium]